MAKRSKLKNKNIDIDKNRAVVTVEEHKLQLIPIQQVAADEIDIIINELIVAQNYAPFFGYHLKYVESLPEEIREDNLKNIFNPEQRPPSVPVGKQFSVGEYIIKLQDACIGTFTMHRALEFRNHYTHYLLSNPLALDNIVSNIAGAQLGVLYEQDDELVFPNNAFSPSIFVMANYRRQGIATIIFELAFHAILSSGYKALSLSSQDNPGSIEMHEKLGLIPFAEGFVKDPYKFSNDYILRPIQKT